MKATVKSAREAIAGKEYHRAISIADRGLFSDEATEAENKQHCYMLLVFKALALHHTGEDDQAAEVYDMAALQFPKLPLAWQVRIYMVHMFYLFIGHVEHVGGDWFGKGKANQTTRGPSTHLSGIV